MEKYLTKMSRISVENGALDLHHRHMSDSQAEKG
jgi:hypothetical protein